MGTFVIQVTKFCQRGIEKLVDKWLSCGGYNVQCVKVVDQGCNNV